MKQSVAAANILSQLSDKTKLGDLRKIAKGIKKAHDLAMELWSAGSLHARLLAILIMDTKRISQVQVDALDRAMQTHPLNERTQLMDWFMANQLQKDKALIALIESWENSPSSLQRRVFWYHQGRLRWTGQKPPPNTTELLAKIEATMATEEPEVQWAMNFTAGWIGIFEKTFRDRCIKLGKDTGLFKGQKVSKGCTPDYLPEFIAIESRKRGL